MRIQLVLILAAILLLSCNNRHDIQIGLKSNQDTTTDSEDTLLPFVANYSFKDLTTSLYTGKLADPNFSRNEFASDTDYVAFIKKGCRTHGINFCGHYTIIQRSCGSMCEHIFIVDRITGRIFTDLSIGNGETYGYTYKNNSSLLIADANLFVDEKREAYTKMLDKKPTLYRWQGSDFVKLQ